MGHYAWSQDVPIDADAYADITSRIGDQPMPGLIAHVVVQADDGHLRYIDVWEDEASCDAAFERVVHPAVLPVLRERGVRADGEPPRTPLRVLEVRTAAGVLGSHPAPA